MSDDHSPDASKMAEPLTAADLRRIVPESVAVEGLAFHFDPAESDEPMWILWEGFIKTGQAADLLCMAMLKRLEREGRAEYESAAFGRCLTDIHAVAAAYREVFGDD